MKMVEMIRQKRQAHFIQKRQVAGILHQREKDRKEVKRDISLIRSAAAGLREKKPRKARVVVMKDGDQDSDEEEEEDIDEEMYDDDDEDIIQSDNEEMIEAV